MRRIESPELAVRDRSKTLDFSSKIAENLDSYCFEVGNKVKCRETFDGHVKVGESGCVAVGLFARAEDQRICSETWLCQRAIG